MEEQKNNKLIAPDTYWKANKKEKENFTNGCGYSGVLGHLVPDSILGLNVENICNVHDWMYRKTPKQKEKADKIFLKNLLNKIDEQASNKFLKILRKGIAHVYYFAVKMLGNPK